MKSLILALGVAAATLGFSGTVSAQQRGYDGHRGGYATRPYQAPAYGYGSGYGRHVEPNYGYRPGPSYGWNGGYSGYRHAAPYGDYGHGYGSSFGVYHSGFSLQFRFGR